jgi:hypothetical protein
MLTYIKFLHNKNKILECKKTNLFEKKIMVSAPVVSDIEDVLNLPGALLGGSSTITYGGIPPASTNTFENNIEHQIFKNAVDFMELIRSLVSTDENFDYLDFYSRMYSALIPEIDYPKLFDILDEMNELYPNNGIDLYRNRILDLFNSLYKL